MEHQKFKKNTIAEMIVQVRFPTIFAIETNDPAEFQAAIFSKFPLVQLQYEKQQDIFVSPDVNIPSSVNDAIVKKNYHFISRDGKSKINLTSDFISFSTLQYDGWESVLGSFMFAFQKFAEIYKPLAISRLGIRYINAFRNSAFRDVVSKWTDLFSDHILGPLAVLDNSVKTYDIDYLVPLTNSVEGAMAKIHAGFGVVDNENETSFIWDGDFFVEKSLTKEDLEDVLCRLHELEYEHFFSCLKSATVEIMEAEGK